MTASIKNIEHELVEAIETISKDVAKMIGDESSLMKNEEEASPLAR